MNPVRAYVLDLRDLPFPHFFKSKESIRYAQEPYSVACFAVSDASARDHNPLMLETLQVLLCFPNRKIRVFFFRSIRNDVQSS